MLATLVTLVNIAENVKRYNCCGNRFGGFLKVKRRIAICFSNSIPKYVPQRNESRDSNRYSHANVYGSVIQNSQRGKPPKCPLTDK